jgi:deoxycytidylate deaminase
MSLTRKEFLNSMVSAVIGAAGAAVLVACSDNPPSADAGTAANCLANGTTVTIGSNHGHTLVVTKDEVNAGVEKAYEIQGTSTHPHTVTVTAALFTMLKNNTSVTATSTSNGSPAHTHTITIMCA